MTKTQHAIKLADLEQTECWADTPHEPTWAKVDPDAWCGPTPCPWCLLDQARDEHRGCEHEQHGRWRSWVATKKLASLAYVLGIIAGYGQTYNATCSGCVTFGVRLRAPRPYVLGWPRWKWTCLLRSHHWPGEYIGLGCCGKCLPCPDCGSTNADHFSCFER